MTRRIGGDLLELIEQMPLTLILNGQQRSFDLDVLAGGPTLAALVAELGLKADRIALELNGTIVSRSNWAKTSVSAGDRLELVHFVGGGSDGHGINLFCPALGARLVN